MVQKTFRNIVLGILIFAVGLGCFWQRADAQVVEIPDPNLERAIRERLELPSDFPITREEMLRLYELPAGDAQIESLTGLEYAHNLEDLIIPNNPIGDLTPIASLRRLESLHLAGIPIEDLTFLKDLTQLRHLHLFACEITDITPLQNLTKLVVLRLEGNRITDLSPLSNLTALQTLRLGHNFIVDISPLANLTQLTDLNLVDNQIVDVSPLANLARLTDLTIASNAITDFRPLFGLNLQSVDIDIHKSQELASSEIEIPDLNLERAIREELGLPSHLPITELEMLRLTIFAAEVAQVENITGLEYARNLKRLYLRGNPIEDLTPIANLTQLELLHLIDVPITDLSPIQNLKELRVLYLSHCRIIDITPISNLTALETLWLQNNYIVDISPLANLTRLETLWINGNNILDFSPIQGLSIPDFRYDEVCLLPDLPIQERIENRDFPSIFQPWDNGIRPLWDDLPGLSHLSLDDRRAYHDLFWHGPPALKLHFQKAPPWSQLSGPIEIAIAKRDELLAKNPNMLFLVHVVSTYTAPDITIGGQFPEDWFGWVRDEAGNPVNARPTTYLIDYRRPEVQDVIVQQAVSVAQCGIFDGILYDSWGNGSGIKLRNRSLPYPDYDEQTHAKLVQEEVEARTTILKRIRENVPDDFLILVNNNHRKSPFSIPYINGAFMEAIRIDKEGVYTRSRIIEIEETLIWYEENAREPQITCLRGAGLASEPPNSPTNQRQMRLFTTMSLTLSDGYVLYVTGRSHQEHIWYPFWDASLGQPIGPTAQRYQEDIEGLYIREFTNGWAVYNRSGQVQTITLPSSATSVSNGGSTAASLTHLLPDLDGEIYLKTKHPADVNGDWGVNILDLVQVSNSLGKSSPDPNGDGVVNILDLVFVSKHFASNED